MQTLMFALRLHLDRIMVRFGYIRRETLYDLALAYCDSVRVNDRMRAEIDDMRWDAQEGHERIALLEAQIAEADRLYGENADLERRLALAEDIAEELERQRDELEEQLADTRSRFHDRDLQFERERDDLERQIDDLRCLLRERDEQLREKEGQLASVVIDSSDDQVIDDDETTHEHRKPDYWVIDIPFSEDFVITEEGMAYLKAMKRTAYDS